MTATAAIVHSPTNELRGYRLAIGWVAWMVIASLAGIIATLSFEALFTGERILVQSQGPLSLQPALANDLQQRLFDLDVLTAGQRAVHVGGSALFAVTAVLIFLRKSRDWVILLSSATLVAAGAALFVPSSVLLAEQPDWASVVRLIGVFDAGPEFWRSIAGVAIVAFAALFPDGRFTSSWSKAFAAVVAAWVALWALLPGISVFDVTSWPSGLQPLWTLGIPVAVVALQVDRYWRFSDKARRRQTRLVVISMSAAVSTFALIWALSPELSDGVDLGLVLVTDRLQTIYDLNLLSLLTVSLMLFPVSIGVSVARYRLFDMDLLLNRALVYGILTGVVALVLFVAVAVVGGLIANQFGRSLGIAVTGLLTIAAFQPLRSRIQRQVDRRFYREKYDADRALDAFVAEIRDEADLSHLESGLLRVIDDTLRPHRATVFLHRPDDANGDVHTAMAAHYLDHPNRPMVTAGGTGHVVESLSDAGIEMVLPLVSHRQLVGVVELGPRQGDRSYSGLDRELLHRIAERAAPAIRFAELAREHAREVVSKERYEQELQLARSIQRDLLPKQVPDFDGWHLSALYEPAREVGGDLYDFIDLGNGAWGVIVADVTDKGVPAAMVMATCRSMLRGVATSPDRPGPGEVLRRVNDLLIPDTPESMFVTCFYAALDPGSGRLTYANAGHSLPMRWSAEVQPIHARGMPLGLMPAMQYEEGSIVMSPGEAVLFYSDGVTEAHSAAGEMYGSERLATWLAGRPVTADLLEDLMADLALFTHPVVDPEDDVTLVVLHREKPPE